MLNKVTCGDCLELMRELPDNYVSSIITDPPYELNFMGKSWDNSGISFNTEVWAECLRVAKPGAFLLAFGGTRTWHRIACAIEDAGLVLRDTIEWIYGSGFPKSLDISKALDKQAGAEREVVGKSSRHGGGTCSGCSFNISPVVPDITAPSTELAKQFDGYGTALKPSHEPIMVFMKPCDGTFAQNAEKWGIAGLNIDGGRIASEESTQRPLGLSCYQAGGGVVTHGVRGGRPIKNTISGSPAGTGRWPANTILSCACEGEHAEDCPVRIMDEQSGVSKSKGAFPKIAKKKTYNNSSYDIYPAVNEQRVTLNDSGGASRFFYCVKPSRAEKEAGLEGFEEYEAKDVGLYNDLPDPRMDREQTRNKTRNSHPTCKPVSLMRYLCKLTRPPHGGIVLDPFTGSGTTGIAAILEGRDFIGFELSPEYTDIANARIKHHAKQEDLCLSL